MERPNVGGLGDRRETSAVDTHFLELKPQGNEPRGVLRRLAVEVALSRNADITFVRLQSPLSDSTRAVPASTVSG